MYRAAVPGKPAQKVKQCPTDRCQQHNRGQNSVCKRRIGKNIFELSDARTKRQKQQRADRRKTHALDGSEELKSPREAPQKRGQVLILFLSHGAKSASYYRR